MKTHKNDKFLSAFFLLFLLTQLQLPAKDSQLYNKYLEYQKKEIAKSKILQADWLRSDLDYIKITTTKDGIARLALSDILAIEPQWIGKNSNYLNLLYNSQNYPYYIKDTDGKLSSDDTLYFTGKRAAGDTTWFDNYTWEEPFFLTYDESSTAKRLNLVDQILNGTSQISSVPINRHIEEEHKYNSGKQLYDSYTSDNEGWYWAMIAPSTDVGFGSTFSYNLYLDLDPGDEIDLYLIFKTSADTLYFAGGSNLYPEYNLTFFFNNDSIDNRNFIRVRKDSFYIHLTSENTIKGYNNIKVIANVHHEKRNAEINIDYITMKGRSKPFAYSQFFNANFENITPKSLVKIPNFKSSRIVGIDSLNNQIFFPTSEIQNQAYLFLNKNNGNLYNFSFRDKMSFDTINNFHLAIIPYSNPDSMVSFHNWYFSGDFNNLVDNAESNSIIVFTINVTSYIPQEVISFINKYGGKLSSKLLDNTAYYIIFQKDNKLIDEDVIQTSKFAKTIKFDNLNLQSNLYTANLVLDNPNSIILLNDETAIEKPKIYQVNKPYLKNSENKADVIVIYNNFFKEQVQNYIEYRSKTTGLVIKPVDVEDIYNEFHYGKKGVQCIKDFLIYAQTNWKDAKFHYLTLFGNASWDPRKVMDNSISTDFVPVYGYPPSDFWYSLLDDDLNPDIAVGRISASTLTDADNYINKLKTYDELPDAPWMKNFLFLSGGYNPDEIRIFSLAKYMFFDEPILSPPFCGTTDSVTKIYDQLAVSETQGGDIRQKINQGALWVNYLGHANSESFDFDGWQAFRLNNYPKYSFFSTLSCNTGAHAEPAIINSRNEDYLFLKDKGFIGSVGSATWGWVDENRFVAQRMIENLADSNSSLVYVSDLINYGKKGLVNQEAQLYTKFHFTLISDPLLKLHSSRIPNLYIYPNDFSILSPDNVPMINTTDSVAYIKGIIYNNGYQTKSESKLLLIDTYQNTNDTLSIQLPIICYNFPFNFAIYISKKPGQHDLTLIIDPEEKIKVEKPQNKIYKTSFYVFSENLIVLDPLAGWNVNKSNPIFRLIDPNPKPNSQYYFSIIDESNGNKIKMSSDDEVKFKENFIEWRPNVIFSGTNYLFEAYYTYGNNQTSEKVIIPFYVSDIPIENNVHYSQSTVKDLALMEFNNTGLDTLNNSVIIKNNMVPYHLVSASRDNSIRWANIEIGNKVYVDNQFALGFNIVTIPIYNDGSVGTYRRFDTWGEHGDNWQLDSMNIELVKYLRDSIPDDSYLFIATGDRSFRLISIYQALSPESIGSLDSLKAVLRTYGSALIDSINGPLDYASIFWDTWPHSFAMIGKKGWKPGEAIEAMSPSGDSSSLTGYLPFYQMEGELNTNIIGPAQKWNQLTINTNINSDSINNCSIILQILGKDNQQSQVVLEKNIADPTEIYDLTSQDFAKYKNLQLKLKFQRDEITADPAFKGFTLDFAPVPEFAMVKSKTIIDDSAKMRGNPSTMHYAFENLSLRTSVDSVLFKITNTTPSGSYQYFQKTYSGLQFNSEIIDSIPLQTNMLSTFNELTSTINPNSDIPEFYNFNNSAVNYFSVFEDTIKPIIKTTFDGKEVSDGDFVARKPLIAISIFDNSPFPINDSTKIEVYINGLFITPLNVDYYNFQIFDSSSDLKAILKIIPNNLEYGQDIINPSNNIKIIAFDPAGNRDTILYRVNVMQNSILQDISTFPNPAKDKVNFKFKYLGRNINEPGSIEIYNLNGVFIRSIKIITQIGENIIPIDLFDKNGSIFSMGVYYYRININSEFYTEPKFGMFVVAR